jgi:ribosome maturation factor RimP
LFLQGVGKAMASVQDKLQALIEPLVQTMGYELVLLEFSPHKGSAMVRLFIDAPGGITLGDCERVSREVEGVLDVEDPIPQNYRLEVSSPGLDRPLRGERDYRRFIGRLAKVVTDEPVAGQSHFAGRLTAVEGDDLLLTEGRRVHRVPMARIRRARLDVEF